MGFKKGQVPHNKGDTGVRSHFRNTSKSPDRKMERMSRMDMAVGKTKNNINRDVVDA